jgi:ribosomal protein S18 acetylase RimI-like enzyme
MIDRIVAPPDVPEAPAIDGLRFRRYAGPGDLPAVVEVLHAARRADGVEWLPSLDEMRDEFAHLSSEQPERDMILAEVDGRLVAYARARWAVRDDLHDYHTSGSVHPDFRRRGLGRALLHAQQDRLRKIAATEQHPVEDTALFTAEWLDGEVGAQAMLAADGYRAFRWFAKMLRPLADPIADAPMPAGLEIRPVEERDWRRIFDAEAEAFRDHFGHREWTEQDYRYTFESSDLDTSLWRVVWDGEEVAAVTETFIRAEQNRLLGVSEGWFDRVSTRRRWRGRGVAKAMISSAMFGLRDVGIETAALGVDTDNPSGALRLYEGLGFTIDGRMELVARPFP